MSKSIKAAKDDLASPSRRRFVRNTALAGGGILMAGATPPVWGAVQSLTKTSAESPEVFTMNIKTRGYAAFDASGLLKPWDFERRPVGDNDILIDVKYASICHSDIHQMKGHWGPQQYPQVPGHEIVGVVTAVGKWVTKFKVGDRAGVGCMVDGCTDCEHGEQYDASTIFTYGYPDKRSPTGISQGGYSRNLVVRDHYAAHKREIFYRLLTTEQGARLSQIVSASSHSHKIAKAISWLKLNFVRPLNVGELAAHTGMSKSAFYAHFRAMTAMSPLQFQKKLRLNEARRLMLTENMDAMATTFKVGYESPSQFSREYSRMFGAPPAKDIKALRAIQSAA